MAEEPGQGPGASTGAAQGAAQTAVSTPSTKASSTPAQAAPTTTAPTSCKALFWAFNRLALQGFGGVLPVAQRELVERLGWLSATEFLELLSLGQILPGPNIVNMALIFGDRFFGWRGAFAAVAGLLLAPLLIVLALAMALRQGAQSVLVADALRGMGVVAAGLVLSTAFSLVKALRRSVLGVAWCVALAMATVLLVAGLRWPLVWALGLMAPMGWLLAWRALLQLRASPDGPSPP